MLSSSDDDYGSGGGNDVELVCIHNAMHVIMIILIIM